VAGGWLDSRSLRLARVGSTVARSGCTSHRTAARAAPAPHRRVPSPAPADVLWVPDRQAPLLGGCGGGGKVLPSCCARLRNNVCIGILAGSLILSGVGCWAVWGPLIGVGAAGGAAIVARKTRSPTTLSISPTPDQTDAGRAPPALPRRLRLPPWFTGEYSRSRPHTYHRSPAPQTQIESPSKPHSSRRRRVRAVASRQSLRKKQAKLTAKVVPTASEAPGYLPPTSICVAPRWRI
jgi:hypothetical protein